MATSQKEVLRYCGMLLCKWLWDLSGNGLYIIDVQPPDCAVGVGDVSRGKAEARAR